MSFKWPLVMALAAVGGLVTTASCSWDLHPRVCTTTEDCGTGYYCLQGGCVANDPVDGGGSDAGSSGDGGTASDGGTADGGSDGGGAADGGTPKPDGGTCTAGASVCQDANTLSVCRSDGSGSDNTTCLLGCSSTGTVHCMSLVPTAPVAISDYTLSGLTDFTIPASGQVLLFTDTGQITGSVTRTANSDRTQSEVNGGIGYRQQDGVGIFSFDSLTVPAGTTMKLIGAAAVALVSSSDITVFGVIDARPMDTGGTLCPSGTLVAGPGGGVGGTGGKYTKQSPYAPGSAGAGPGAGGGASGGGGGAGHVASGGAGAGTGGSGGVDYGAGAAIQGGSGGGGGGATGNADSGYNGGPGGGGGGAVRLVANGAVTVGNGSDTGGVNAGGCGGEPGDGSGGVYAGGGGGGSGGAIFVEAPVVQLNPSGGLAANGGGGVSLIPQTIQPEKGGPGGLGTVPANGGGKGGAGGTPAGESATCPGCAGGGAAGPILIRTRAGSPTVKAGAILSPSEGSGASYGTAAAQ